MRGQGGVVAYLCTVARTALLACCIHTLVCLTWPCAQDEPGVMCFALVATVWQRLFTLLVVVFFASGSRAFPRWFSRYKIARPSSAVTLPAVQVRAWKDFVVHTIAAAPVNMLIYGLLLDSRHVSSRRGFVGMDSAPSMMLWLFLVFGACMVVSDFTTYWVHRGMHAWPLAYRWLHKYHHDIHAPTVWMTESVTDGEALLNADTLQFLVVTTFGSSLVPPVIALTWIVVRLVSAYEAHSGFQLPWSAFGDMPTHHDRHHTLNRGCYGSTSWWDRQFGTLPPRQSIRAPLMTVNSE